MTIEEVKKSLNRYYSDTSRSKEDTLADLKDLEEEIQILKEALEVE